MLIRLPKEITKFLKENRHRFDTPQCYLGSEPNTHEKKWDDPNIKLRILLFAPWRYEDFRGNQTIPLLYQILNSRDDILCDRAFFPNTEKEYNLFRKNGYPIFGLETRHSMGEYDIILTSLSFIPPWINFPLALSMSGIPSFWKDRISSDIKYPLIMVGGSAMYGNFGLAYPVADLIYMGDAEEGLFPVLDVLMSDEKRGRAVERVAEEFDYVFVPYFYDPIYEGEKFFGWETTNLSAKKSLKVIKVKDMDKVPALVKPIPSFTDTTMGLGEVEISRGCRAVCAFCGIGWKYKPYRERSKDKMVELLLENYYSGGASTLCPIATEFAYYSHKQNLIRDLCEEVERVDPLSMRVDAFIDDPDFDAILAERGMNQVALGVEAPSQRLRNRLMKGITEEQILRACEIAIEKGYRRLKFFMISNIDETEEDFEEFFALLRKVRAIVTSRNMKERSGSDIQIVCSWTPWFTEPCTPLQWKAPTIEQRKDWKNVDEVLRGELKAKFKLGIKNEENFLWVMQGMHLGDTRFAEAVVHASLDLKRPFYVSFAKKTKATVTKYLKETGGSWEQVMREKGLDETFLWDIVDRGVPKEALKTIYKKITSGVMDTKVQKLPVPTDRADFVGFQGKKNKILDWYLCSFAVPEEYEVVPNTHIKAIIHRNSYGVGFPLTPGAVHFFSDRDARNWHGGVEFAAIGVSEDVSNRIFPGFLPYIPEKTKFLFSDKNKGMKWKEFASRYVVTVQGFYAEEVHDFLDKLEKKEELIIKVPETRYFSGTYSKKSLDLRQSEVKFEVPRQFIISHSHASNTTFLVHLSHEVGIRYFLQLMFSGVSFSRILQFRVDKTHLLLWPKYREEPEEFA